MNRLTFSEAQRSLWQGVFWWLQDQGAVLRLTCSDACQCGKTEPFDCKIRNVDTEYLNVRQWDRANSAWVGNSFYVKPEHIFIY